MFIFPFEDAAKRGEVPDNLDLINTGACYRLVKIYKKYYDAGQTDEARWSTGLEKEQLRRDWEFARKREERQTQLWKEMEIAAERCRKNSTRENALALCNAMVGIQEGTA